MSTMKIWCLEYPCYSLTPPPPPNQSHFPQQSINILRSSWSALGKMTLQMVCFSATSLMKKTWAISNTMFLWRSSWFLLAVASSSLYDHSRRKFHTVRFTINQDLMNCQSRGIQGTARLHHYTKILVVCCNEVKAATEMWADIFSFLPCIITGS